MEKIRTQISCSIIFFPESRVVYKTMWKNMVQSD